VSLGHTQAMDSVRMVRAGLVKQ